MRFFSEQQVVGRGPGAWKTSALLLGAEYFFVIQGGEGISHKAFHYLGHLGLGAGAQNTLGKEIHGCLFKISLFTVLCRFCSRRVAKCWHQERNWLRAVHGGHWGFEHWKIKKRKPEISTFKLRKKLVTEEQMSTWSVSCISQCQAMSLVFVMNSKYCSPE